MNRMLVGPYGETCAARYLRAQGYTITGAGYRIRLGELDIIAQRDGITVFVEVKTRTQGMLAAPAEAVDYQKRRRLAAAAKSYIRARRITGVCRFDVVEVTLAQDGGLQNVRHIPNAFDAEE